MPTDKLAHLALGALIAGAALVVLGGLWAIGGTVVAAIGKEAWDYYRHGRPDVWDALSTIAGGGLVLGAVWML